jgi:hypothetical protein
MSDSFGSQGILYPSKFRGFSTKTDFSNSHEMFRQPANSYFSPLTFIGSAAASRGCHGCWHASQITELALFR